MTHPDLEDVLGPAPGPAVIAHLAGCPRCRADRRAWLGRDAPLVLQVAPALPDRYTLLLALGTGAYGEVYRARDHTLDRDIAIKVLRADRLEHAGLLEAEARRAARLQHPAIPPIYEVGRLGDGRPYVAMAEARGTSLRVALAEPHAPGHLRRFVAVAVRVCAAVAFAHGRDVVHRDLKPENLRLGPLDAVTVVDWGLASSAGDPQPGGGTPGYRAPEQRDAGPAIPASDVYALGTLLAEILGSAPEEGCPVDLPPGTPEALRDAVLRARDPDPDARPSAHALGEQLQAWLSGEALTERALERVAEADALWAERDGLRRKAILARASARAALGAARTWQPAERKQAGWAEEDRAATLDRQAEHAELAGVDVLHRALDLAPDLPDAVERLAAHHQRALRDAERDGPDREVARHLRALGALGAGPSAWITRPGRLALRVSRPVEVVAERLGVVHRRSVPVERRALGCSARFDVALEPGSWRLVLGDLGVLPVVIHRGETWTRRAPSGDDTLILPDEPPPRGVVWIPAGWFRAGGDAEAIDALSAREVWVDGLFVQREPVTLAAWLRFLADDPDPAHVPGEGPDSPPVIRRSSSGAWLPHGVDPGGLAWHPEAPVVKIPLRSALAYAAWWSARTGARWDLPHELEWEKLARGTDARRYPWGDLTDPVFANGQLSRPVAPSLAPVDGFPHDVSPYGVRGLGGNTRDWCLTPWLGDGDTPHLGRVRPLSLEAAWDWVVVRGGAWDDVSAWARVASRRVVRPGDRDRSVGFRLVTRQAV